MPIKHSSNSSYKHILPQPGYPQALLIRGRVGYAYIFRQYGLRRTIGHYHYPYDPKLPTQLAARNRFAYAIGYWQGFSNAVKQYYNAMQYPEPMSGYNRFIRHFMLYW